jgi:hypothetical protein
MSYNTEDLLITKQDNKNFRPIFFDLSNPKEEDIVNTMIADGRVQYTVDDYEELLLELFGINNPAKVYTSNYKNDFKDFYESLKKEKPLYKNGKWVYFPWSSKLVHILNEPDFEKVRTARNKNLISHEEQQKFYNATVGIGGLSVGSSVAFALTLQGGPKHLKLADMDRLALSNTNRILIGVDNLGILKVEMVARRIYEINPYAEIEIFPEGLHPENIDTFFKGLDIVVDELDNIAVKYLIREKAKEYKIPVLMGTDNGDNAVIDIERYDLDESIKYFHGRLGEDLSYDSLLKLDKFGIGKMATKCVGADNVTVRMQESLLEMGKTIVSWPQLGGAALVNGVAVAYCIRKILNNQSVEDNRVVLSIDEKFTPDYLEEGEILKRKYAADTFRKVFGL